MSNPRQALTDDEAVELVLDAATPEALELLRQGKDGFFVCAIRTKEPELGVTTVRQAIPGIRALGA